MKTSIQKLQNYFKLESQRGYDNRAVMGGLERMLDHWEADAHADELPEELIKVVAARVRDYSRLTPKSRSEALAGIWQRVQRTVDGAPSISFAALSTQPEEPVTTASSPRGDTTAPTEEKGSLQQQQSVHPASQKTQKAQKSKLAPRSAALIDDQPAALNAPVTVLKGVGESSAKTLERLDLHTLGDMLYYFPRRYVDYSKLIPINRLKYGDEVTVIGTVQSVNTRSLRGGKLHLVEIILSDGSGSLKVTWFNQKWLAQQLKQGTQISISGKIDQYLGRLVMNSPTWEYL